MVHQHILLTVISIFLLLPPTIWSAHLADTTTNLAILKQPFPQIRGALGYVIENYSKFRDYYARPNQLSSHITLSHFYPWLAISNIVARAANRTLIEPEDICYYTSNCTDGKEVSNIPKILPILPIVMEYQNYNFSGLSIWDNLCSTGNQCSLESGKFKKFSNNKKRLEADLPSMFLVYSELINFAYCGVPQKVTVSSWKFAIFTDPFDKSVWIVLSVSFLILSMTIQTSKDSKILSTILSVYSAMLLHSTHTDFGSSGIFMLWVFVSIMLTNLYTADMTSTVISPPPDDVITSFSQLHQRNFTLREWEEESYIKFVNSSIMAMKPNSRMRRTMESIIPKAIYDISFKNFYDNIYFGNNKFIVSTWKLVLYIVHHGHRVIKMEEHTKRRKIERKCYVGKDLICYDDIFFATLPPGNREMAEGFQKLFEAGIVQRFHQEFEGALTSERVQDRSRMVDRTHTKETESALPDSLKLLGKTVTIFLMWMFCIKLSLSWFLLEHCFTKSSKLIQMTGITSNVTPNNQTCAFHTSLKTPCSSSVPNFRVRSLS